MIRSPKLWVEVLALLILVGLALPVLAAETAGSIQSVTPAKLEFVLKDSKDKSWTFQLAKDAKVLLNGKEAKLTDLYMGDMATITYEKKGDKLMASMVRAARK